MKYRVLTEKANEEKQPNHDSVALTPFLGSGNGPFARRALRHRSTSHIPGLSFLPRCQHWLHERNTLAASAATASPALRAHTLPVDFSGPECVASCPKCFFCALQQLGWTC